MHPRQVLMLGHRVHFALIFSFTSRPSLLGCFQVLTVSSI
jgi:hypothetical protein